MIGSLEQFKARLTAASDCVVLAIAGGSGSGKTTVARKIHEIMGPELSAILAQDFYYIDQSAKFDGDGGSVNFDHPSSLDFALMAKHLELLLKGLAVEAPIYEFASHKRSSKTLPFPPKPLILLDGTLILAAKELRPYFTRSVFVQTSEELRFQRRLERDVRERGRTVSGIEKQFLKQVKPMHDQFVEPSKEHATLIISGEGDLDQALNLIFAGL